MTTNPTLPVRIHHILFAALLPASLAAADISFPNFNSVAGLSFNGVAAQSAGVGLEPNTISLTPPAGNSAGSVWYNTLQPIAPGFDTTFQFRIRDRSGLGADGFAFVLQNDPRALSAIGGRGGGIGFGTNLFFPTDAGPGITNSLAIVFDVWDNSADWPSIPGANILTVQAAPTPNTPNLPTAPYSLAHTSGLTPFGVDAIHTVRIHYIAPAVPGGGPGTLRVYYDDLALPALTLPITLSTHMNLAAGAGGIGSAYAGFTSATGGPANSERHEILNWNFTAPAPTAAAPFVLLGLLAARRRR